MSAFKVGDKVRCIDGSFPHDRVYTVSGVHLGGIEPGIDLEGVSGWHYGRFESVDRHAGEVLAVWCLVELARSGRIIWGHDKPRPEWVRLTTDIAGFCEGDVRPVDGWSASGNVQIENVYGFRCVVPGRYWEPADPPEPTVTIELPLFAAKFHAEFRPAPGELNPYYAVSAACRTALGDQEYAAAMDELGAHHYEMEQTNGPR